MKSQNAAIELNNNKGMLSASGLSLIICEIFSYKLFNIGSSSIGRTCKWVKYEFAYLYLHICISDFVITWCH